MELPPSIASLPGAWQGCDAPTRGKDVDTDQRRCVGEAAGRVARRRTDGRSSRRAYDDLPSGVALFQVGDCCGDFGEAICRSMWGRTLPALIRSVRNSPIPLASSTLTRRSGMRARTQCRAWTGPRTHVVTAPSSWFGLLPRSRQDALDCCPVDTSFGKESSRPRHGWNSPGLLLQCHSPVPGRAILLRFGARDHDERAAIPSSRKVSDSSR